MVRGDIESNDRSTTPRGGSVGLSKIPMRLASGGGSVLPASVVALLLLLLWWAGVNWLDGALAEALPYRQYATVALAYPDVYYPGLPGWFLAQVQPFPAAIWVVAIGWMVALSVGIGVVATRLASDRGPPASAWAAAIVVALFVGVTILEAALALVP